MGILVPKKMKTKTFKVVAASVLVYVIAFLLVIHGKPNYLSKSEQLYNKIIEFYGAETNNLFIEIFPYEKENRVTYLAEQDTISGNKVAYLWPYSSMLSATTALLKTEEKEKYQSKLQQSILPGLEEYLDTLRLPIAYQSYCNWAGFSDRFYDDNIWLAIDFCDLYELTQKAEYKEKAEQLWKFVISGWDTELGGGIYWCEQKRQSKNTCSNAPAAVLACKLYKITHEKHYMKQAVAIYEWTKANFQDSSDYLYFDKSTLDGEIDSTKYAYNSGQMLQAASLLYKTQGDPKYYKDAENIAQAAIEYFTGNYTVKGGTIPLFKNNTNWFTTVMLRGYVELWTIDGNDNYTDVYRQNMDLMLKQAADENGLYSKDWSGENQEDKKWLLDQASLVELLATLSAINNQN